MHRNFNRTRARHSMWLLPMLLLTSAAAVAQDRNGFVPAFLIVPQRGQFGWTELMAAARDGDATRAAALIESGSDVNAVGADGSSALIIAASAGHTDVVQALLEADAEVDVRNDPGQTALAAALSSEHPAVALALLAGGADPDAAFSSSGMSALELTAVHGYSDVAAALIAQGADLAQHGGDALRAAVWKGETDVVSTLLAAGVDVNAPGDRSALSFAISEGHADLAVLLLDRGAQAAYTDIRDAARYGQGTLAATMLRSTGIEALTPAQYEELIAIADRANAEQFLTELLAADSGIVGPPAHERLVFVRRDSDTCEVSLWDSRAAAAPRVLTVEARCPEQAFVAERAGIVYLLYGTRVRSVGLSDGETYEFELPLAQFEAAVDGLRTRFAQNGLSNLDWMRAEPSAIGVTDAGQTAVSISVRGPADGTYIFQFSETPAAWAFTDEDSCGRFADVCAFAGMDGRPLELWPQEQSVWHPEIRRNRFFVSKESASPPGGYVDDENGTVLFAIDDRLTTVRYSMAHGGHSDGIYTTWLEIQIDADEPLVLTNRLGQAAISGRYVLIGGARDAPYEVFDLDSASSVFGPLELAAWIP